MFLSRLLRRLGLVMVCITTLAVAAAPQSEPLDPQVADAFGVRAGTIVSLDLDLTPGVPTSMVVPIDGIDYTLDMFPHSVRDPDFVFLVQLADGSYVEKDPGPIRTLQGNVRELPGSEVAGSMLETGIAAAIRLPDGELFWIEPIASRLAGFDSDLHVIYAEADVLPNGGVCGTRDADAGGIVLEEEGDPGTSSGGQIAQLGCDSDVEYFIRWGSNEDTVKERIQLVIHTMNFQYFRDVNILHLITAIIVRTSEPDPYSSSSCGPLLNQFTNRWRNFEPERSIKRDVAELFTGKNLIDCAGIAWLSGICSPALGYNVVQSDCCGGLSCATDLSAHEFGHNWSAPHCSCPGFTMHTPLQCANQFHPNLTIPRIVNYRNSRFCLDKLNPLSLPFTDDFPMGHIDSFKWSNGVGIFLGAGQNPPSPPFVALLDRTDVLESHTIDTSGVNPGSALRFSFYTEERFAEAGDFFFAEYLNSSDVWTTVFSEEGDDHGNQDQFDFHEFVLGDDAKHGDFRIRFRTAAGASDSWAVDDVSVSAGDSGICIVHGNTDWDREDPETHVPYDDWAFSGYIDPAVESSNGTDLDRGKTTFNLVFNVEPFGDAGGGPITTDNFSVEETGAGPPPTVVSATKSGLAVSVVLSRIITLQEWTTIVANVWSGDGTQIVDGGNEGQGAEECSRMDVAFQPGDVNNSGSGQPVDLSRWISSWNAGQIHPPDVSKGAVTDYTDISRNGDMDPVDVNRLIAAFKGQSPFTRNWRNLSLNNAQP